MESELKEKWVNALRSGEYKQGRNRLVDYGNNFCCLGVLCEVAGFKRVDVSYINPNPEDEYDRLNTSLDTGALSFVDIKDDEQEILVTMNDNDGKNFDEIADWVEENL